MNILENVIYKWNGFFKTEFINIYAFLQNPHGFIVFNFSRYYKEKIGNRKKKLHILAGSETVLKYTTR